MTKSRAEILAKLIPILREQMPKAKRDMEMTEESRLTDLEIESLNMAIIVFNVEDQFGIEIPYKPSEEFESLLDVGAIVTKIDFYLQQQLHER